MFSVIYSSLGYLAFLGVFGVFVLFTDGLWLPKTVDSAGDVDLAFALLVNLGLIVAFGLQHSIMARESFKKRLTAILPVHLERSTFVWASSLMLALLMVAWQPIAGRPEAGGPDPARPTRTPRGSGAPARCSARSSPGS